ncbi:hypothetical protein L6452_28807 [Arctium lappa]|uniref:Uncharacterized protein n=1 Tax=Arctium lappa TaxID=4217 RepID=A0ACB9A0U6_ARCLA|nr:hypothetical protein L6452_28807 [Arctium lappa]
MDDATLKLPNIPPPGFKSFSRSNDSLASETATDSESESLQSLKFPPLLPIRFRHRSPGKSSSDPSLELHLSWLQGSNLASELVEQFMIEETSDCNKSDRVVSDAESVSSFSTPGTIRVSLQSFCIIFLKLTKF